MDHNNSTEEQLPGLRTMCSSSTPLYNKNRISLMRSTLPSTCICHQSIMKGTCSVAISLVCDCLMLSNFDGKKKQHLHRIPNRVYIQCFARASNTEQAPKIGKEENIRIFISIFYISPCLIYIFVHDLQCKNNQQLNMHTLFSSLIYIIFELQAQLKVSHPY